MDHKTRRDTMIGRLIWASLLVGMLVGMITLLTTAA